MITKKLKIFGYEYKVYPYNQTFNLLLITEKSKSHFVFIKDFNKLMFSRTRHKDKKLHCMSCLQSFTTDELLSIHIKQCLLINGYQAVKYGSGAIKFTSYNKQIPIIFFFFSGTECFLIRTNSQEGENRVKYQEHLPIIIVAILVCIDDRFTLRTVFFKGKGCINKFITWVLDKQKWTKQITKKYFKKRLIMKSENEEIRNNSHMLDMETRIKYR